MTAIVLTLKTRLQQRLDVSPLTPENLSAMTVEQIGGIGLHYGNRMLPVRDFFDLESVPDRDGVLFSRGDERLDGLGRGMTAGMIHVRGDAGAYVGMQMKAGCLTVEGNAGPFCGCEMRGGELRVRGDVGDFSGGALPGDRKGMAGGLLVVGGRAGDRVGDHMRRGLIVIEGDAGAYVGSRMTAGTIAVNGRLGPHAGYAMKRGTLLLARAPEAMSATFNDCGTHTLGFLPLLLRSPELVGTSFADYASQSVRVRRYAGDQATLGKGEILVILSASI